MSRKSCIFALPFEKSYSDMSYIATIGFFDGVHCGHRFLFEQLRREAAGRGLQPLIITFTRPPCEVLSGSYIPELLTSVAERQELLELQADVRMLDFEQVYRLTAQQFLQWLHSEGVRALLMGYDHRFGSDRLTVFADYRAAGERLGVEVLQASRFGGQQEVSSTHIRQLLHEGNIAEANRLLGYRYGITGQVVRGNGIGHQLGFPTANIAPDDPHKLMPLSGVYAAEVANLRRRAILNIGTNPTVGNTHRTIEVHIPDFEADLYGATLTVHILRRLRDEQRFPDLDALKRQIEKDVRDLQ